MPQSWDMGQFLLLPLWRKTCWGFYVRKIQRLRPGLNPQTWVPDHRSRLVRHQIVSEGDGGGGWAGELCLSVSGIERLSPISYVVPRVRMLRAMPSLPLTSTWRAAYLSTRNRTLHVIALCVRSSQQSCVSGKRNSLPAFCDILFSFWLAETRLDVTTCFL